MAKPRTNAKALDDAGRNALRHIQAHLAELKTIADRENFGMLAYLLDMAAVEAEQMERTGSRG